MSFRPRIARTLDLFRLRERYSSPGAPRRPCGLRVERLEDRSVPAVVTWVDWTSATAGGSGSARGELAFNGTTVAATYTGQIAFAQTGGGTNYWNPSGAYISSAVSNAPPASDIIALSTATAKTLAFDQPVADLLLAFVSLNGNGFDFDRDFDILSTGAGYWGTGTVVKETPAAGVFRLRATGGEPHGVIRFRGAYDSFTWRSAQNEFWHGFTVGAVATARPDLAVTAAGPTHLAPGQPKDVTWAVTNSGGEAAAATWADRVYLSADAALDAADTPLATVPAADQSPLAAGASYTRTAAVDLPAGTAPGGYFLLVKADHADAQSEAGEANNLATVPVTVVRPPAVTAVAPSGPTAGPAGGATLTLSAPVLGAAARDRDSYHFISLGADRVPGGGDDVQLPVVPSYTDGAVTIALTLVNGDPLPEGAYQLTARSGTPGLRAANGVPLDGNNDGVAGDPLVTTFVVDRTGPELVGPAVDGAGRITFRLTDRTSADWATATNTAHYTVTASGGDGVFGNGNDAAVPIDTAFRDGTTDRVHLTFSPALGDEVYRLFVDGTGGLADMLGNPLAGGDTTVTLTRNAVAAAVGVDLQASSDTGASSTDNITRAVRPVFDLAINEPGTVRVDVNGDGTADGTRVFAAAGTYPITAPFDLADGTYTVGVTFTPTAGAAATAALAFTVDTRGPTLLPAGGGAGTALRFDGADDYVALGDVLDAGTASQTVEAWFHKTTASTAFMKLVNKGLTVFGTPQNAGYHLRVRDGVLEFGVHDGANFYTAQTAEPATNAWHHVAGVLDRAAGRVRLYLDGVQVATTAVSSLGSLDTNIPLAVGVLDRGAFGARSEFFQGQIDEVRIWTVARSAAEIASSMGRQLAGTETGLAGYWRFDEAAGTAAADLSGNGRHGTLGGGTAAARPAWVASGAPVAADTEQAPLDGRVLTFDEPVDPATAAPANFVLTGPGATAVTTAATFGAAVALEFAPLVAPGGYAVTATGVRDLAGNVGPTGVDWFALLADVTRPAVASVTPSGPVNAAVSQLTVTFTERMNPATFTPADVALTRPDGTLIPAVAVAVTPVDGVTFTVTFPTQSAEGTYGVAIGPLVEDLAGNAMGTSTALRRALLAFYSFDAGTAADDSRSGRDGTLSPAAPVATTDGHQGRAFEFGAGGTNTFVTAPLDINPVARPALTMGAWVRARNVAGVIRGILSHDDGGFDRTLDVDVRGGSGLRYSAFTGGGVLGGPPVAADTWTFLAARYDHAAGTVRLDVNGATFAAGGRPGGGRATTTIGRNPGFDAPFVGTIDNVFFFDRALTDAELAEVRSLGAGVLAEADAFQSTFVIDRTTPAVAAVSPAGTVGAPVSVVEVTFAEPVRGDTLTAADFALTGPDGGSIAVADVTLVAGTTYRVTFPEQRRNGAYTLAVGPDVLDLAGNRMAAASAHPFTIALPDLVLDPAAPPPTPPSATFGRPLDVTWTVKNAGTGPTPTGATSILLTSAGGDITLAVVPGDAVPLAPGASRTRTATVALPLGPAEGQYALAFVTDSGADVVEADEGNNRGGTGPFPVANPPLPDLRAGGVAAPAAAYAGTQVEVFWTVTNAGTDAAAGTWTDQVLLSADPASGGGLLLGSFAFTGSIPAGGAVTRRQVVTIPPAETGTRWLVVRTDAGGAVLELNEANNASVGGPVTLTPLPQPNLVVSAVAPPPSAFSDQQTVVRWDVTNTGTGATSAPFWSDAVYLSDDPVLDAADTPLGAADNPSYLNPGESYRNTLTVTLPQGIEGSYYFLVLADASGRVDESPDEGDNVRAGGPFPVTLTPPPDLQVTAVQRPAFGFSGQPAAVTWTATNRGAGRTPQPATWNDEVYLSTDAVLDAADALLGRFPHAGALDPGESYTTIRTVTLPVAVSGDYFLIVRTDSQNHVFEHAFEGNNASPAASATRVFLTPPPDLVAAEVAAPAAATSGRPLTVSYRVNNDGSTDTPNTSWTDTVYLSADAVLSPATDRVLATRARFGSLEVGQGYTPSMTVTLGNGLTGTYFVIVAADSGGGVFELDDANNVAAAAAPVVITSRPADLVVTAAAFPPAAEAGRVTRVTYTVANAGAGDTAVTAWQDRVVASADGVLGNGDDVLLAAYPRTGLLDAGGSYTRTADVPVPFELAGPYTLFVVADAGGQVTESDDANNASAGAAVAVTRQAPDLQVTAVTAPGSADGTLNVGWTVRNLGTNVTNANYWYDAVYLSRDPLLSGDDLPLGTVRRANPLAAGGEYAAVGTFGVPAGAAGSYFVLVRADGTDLVLEAPLEGNNVGAAANATAVTGGTGGGTGGGDPGGGDPGGEPGGGTGGSGRPPTGPAADLRAGGVTAPTAAVSGGLVTVGWAVTNDGPNPAAGDWYDAVYLSRDQVFDPATDLYVGYADRPAGGLAVGAGYAGSLAFGIPAGLSGPFYAFVLADAGRAVNDPDRFDNLAYHTPGALVSLAPPADLVVGTFVLPAGGVAGREAALTYSITNRGSHPAAGGWYDAVYLSADAAWDLDDPLFARVFRPDGLAAGAAYTQTATAPLPAVAPGLNHVIVRTDIRNQVAEADEGNNLGGSLDRVDIDAERLALGVPTAGVLAAGQSAYYRVDVAAGETLSVELQSGEPGRAVELFVRHGRMPTRSEYDAGSFQPFRDGQRVVVEATRGGTYYLLAYGSGPAAAPVTVTARAVGYTVFDEGYGRGGTAGDLTIEVNGAKFDRTVTAALVGPGGAGVAAIRHQYDTSTRLYATFDLRGAPPGRYDVVVTRGDGEARTVAAGLEVVAVAGPAAPRPSVEAPERVRRNAAYSFTARVVNDTLNDLPAPLLQVGNSTPFSADPADPGGLGTRHTLVGVNTAGGPAGVLRPGRVESLTFFSFSGPDPGDHTVTVDRLGVPNRPFDWAGRRAALTPAGATEAVFEPVFRRLVARVGPDWADYLAMLARNASLLPREAGDPSDPQDLMALEVRLATADVGTSVRGRVVAPDMRVRLGGQVVVARNRSTGESFTTRTLTDGSFVFERVSPGEYEFVHRTAVVREVRPGAVQVEAGQAVAGVELVATPGAVVRGVVRAPDGRAVPFPVVRVGPAGQPAAVVVGGADGSFTATGLPAGTYPVTADAAGYARTEGVVTVGEAGEAEVVLTAAEEGRVTGELRPAAGAVDPERTVVRAVAAGGPAGAAAFFATFDGSRFTLAGLPAGTYAVSVDSGGYVPVALTATVAAGEVADLGPVDLTPAAVVRGAVASRLPGVPASAATVLVSRDGTAVTSAVPDEAGAFEVPDLPPGTYSLRAVAASDRAFGTAQTVTVAAGQTLAGVELSLLAGAVIAGMVRDAVTGAPVADVDVRVVGTGGEVGAGRTGPDGRYAVPGLDLGTYRVGLSLGLHSATTPVAVTALDGAQFTGDVSVPVGGRLEGTVRSAGGVPAAAAAVTLYRHGAAVATAITGPDGGYFFLLTGGGTFDLAVAGAGGFPVATGVPVPAGRTVTVDFAAGTTDRTLALSPLATVGGRVTDAAGRPVRGAVVVLDEVGGGEASALTLSDGEGAYSFAVSPAGTYTLSAFADGLEAAVAVLTVAGDTARDLTLSASAVAVTGAATGPDGGPLVGATVRAFDSAGRLTGIARTDLGGGFVLSSVPPGEAVVTIQAAGSQTRTLAGLRVLAGDNPLGAVAVEAVAVPRAAADPVGPAGDGPPGGGLGPQFLPDWLDVLLFDFRRPDEVRAVPPLPEGCESCAGAYAAVTDAIPLQQYTYDQARAAQSRLRTAALTFGEQFFADIFRFASEIVPLVRVMKFFKVGGPVYKQLLKVDESCAVALADAAVGLTDLIDSVKQKGEEIRSAPTSERALEVLDEIVEILSELVDSLFDIIGKNLTCFGKNLEKFDHIADIVDFNAELQTLFVNTRDNLTFAKSREALGSLNQVEREFLSLRDRYDVEVLNAQVLYAEYLACLAAACGDPDDPGGGDPEDPGGGDPEDPEDPDEGGPDDRRDIRRPAAIDPNDILGPAGFGPERWVAGQSTLAYTVRFENLAAATAAAQQVVVTQTLDPDLDPRTFRFTGFGFGETVTEVPDGRAFLLQRLDLRATKGYFVDVFGALDVAAGTVTWVLSTVDPATGDQPSDPAVGFLPPNDATGRGDGFLRYTVRAKTAAPTGARIDAEARIVFDTEAPIDTPRVFNTLDNGPPASRVDVLPAAADASFLVTWAGTDDDGGSAVASYTVFVSADGGAFEPWLADTTRTEGTFDGRVGVTYRFYSAARDNAGNEEAAPPTPDAVTRVPDPTPPAVADLADIAPDPRAAAVDEVTVTFTEAVDSASLDAGDLTLTRDGAAVSLAGVALTVTPVGTGHMFRIGGLGPVTVGDGDYVLTVAGAGVRSADGVPGVGAASDAWTNDRTEPTARVVALRARQPATSFVVTVTGSDPRAAFGTPSGVASYDVFASVDGGAWSFWRTLPAAAPAATYDGDSDHTYAFYAVARDAAGNVEGGSATAEASTYVPDLTPPDTRVTAVNSATPTFTVTMTGTDGGGSGLAFFDVFVSVDGGPPTAVGRLTAGAPAAGVYSRSLAYQAIADNLNHSYRFFSVGVDALGNTEAAPAAGDVTASVTFAPAQLAVAGFDVQKGMLQRSFVRYLDVTFNTPAGVADLLLPGRTRLRKFNLDGTGSGAAVSLTGVVTQTGSTLAFDFGPTGLGGNPNTNAADGWYWLEFDLDGNGSFEVVRKFYRLHGDVDGDREVTAADRTAVTNSLGRQGLWLEEDVNGDGVVNAQDRTLAGRAIGRKLLAGLDIDD